MAKFVGPLIGVLTPIGFVGVQLDYDFLAGIALENDDGAGIALRNDHGFNFVAGEIFPQRARGVFEHLANVRFAGLEGFRFDAIAEFGFFRLSGKR